MENEACTVKPPPTACRRVDSVILDAAAVEALRTERLLTRLDLQRRARRCAYVVWAAHNSKPISLRSAKAIAWALGVDARDLRPTFSMRAAAEAVETTRPDCAVPLAS